MNHALLRPVILGASLLATAVVAQTNTFPSTGNVGIGTTAPGEKLQVVGGNLSVLNNSNSTAGSNYAGLRAGSTPQLAFVRSVNNWSDTWWDLTMGTDNRLRLGFCTVPQMTFINGSVGLGIDTPAARLHVNGTLRAENGMLDVRSGSKTADSWPFRIASTETSGWNELRINRTGATRTWSIQTGEEGISFPVLALQPGGGKVGIGTTNPYYKFEVVGTGYFKADPDDGSVEIGSGNDGIAYIDLHGKSSLASDFGARIAYSDGGGMSFERGYSSFLSWMKITNAGNVGIGTTNPTNKLEVNGTIRAKEVIVETTGWSDYVFAPDYRLAPLAEVKAHIATAGHLPGIPSATEVAQHGVSVGDMQSRLLAKVEEMTLHLIALSEKVDAQSAEIAALRSENAALRQR